MLAFVTLSLATASVSSAQVSGQVISLNSAESSGYRQYTYTTTAESSSTWLSFLFRHDPSFWGFDDVSFVSVSGSTNLLTNPGFESGLSGWSLIGQQGLPFAGYVRTGSPANDYHSPRSGTKYWWDGAVGGVDGFAQAVTTTPGAQYTLSFYLAGGVGGSPSSNSVLFRAFVGSQAYPGNVVFTPVSTGTVTSGTVTATSGQQLNVPTASGGTIDSSAGYASVTDLSGATLTTGSYGAAITNFSAGVLNTAPGSSVTVGTFSSGSVNAASNSSIAINTMNAGVVSAAAGARLTIGSLNSGSIAMAPGAAVTVTQGGDFSGSLSGSGSLLMRGDGTLTVNSPNTFTGGTEISNGLVQVVASDALGNAPIRMVNNGRFWAASNVAINNRLVATNSGNTYEHVFDTNDSLTNYADFSYAYGDATASIGAGDTLTTTGTVSSAFNWNGTLTLDGLDQTRFLLVMDMDGLIPANASADDYFLAWLNPANEWVKATAGNHGTAGSLAGGYAGVSYASFLTSHGGWNGETMLGAYGVDWVNNQVWAVIDHNSTFGVVLDGGIHLVPEPASLAVTGIGLAGGWMWLKRRLRRRPVGRGTA